MNRITFLLLAAFSGFGLLGCRSQRRECTACLGSGKKDYSTKEYRTKEGLTTCYSCGGKGYVVRCPACGGTAFLKDKNADCANCSAPYAGGVRGWVEDREP
jgi:DnaJ-class molecular chaperone